MTCPRSRGTTAAGTETLGTPLGTPPGSSYGRGRGPQTAGVRPGSRGRRKRTSSAPGSERRWQRGPSQSNTPFEDGVIERRRLRTQPNEVSTTSTSALVGQQDRSGDDRESAAMGDQGRWRVPGRDSETDA